MSYDGFQEEHLSNEAPLVKALKFALENPTFQFHIPGHTKGVGVYSDFKKLIGENALQIDTTDEFDNLGTLHPATGPIKDAEIQAAMAFDSKRTFFLVNGSTVGNLALAMALTKKGEKVIVNRNCHRSILTGLIITGAQPLWLVPERLEEWGIWGNVSPSSIDKLLSENNDVSLVWVTNPTYEGVISDISEISKICKKYQVPLIVDEAHGCLWKFSENLPASSLDIGADAVVHSLHKTGGSLTQSSMLHISKDSLIDADRVEKALKLLHTTSPSLLLLGSLDAARAHLQSKKGQRQIDSAINNAKYFRRRVDKMKNISQLKSGKDYKIDITKIFIKAEGISGIKLESILEVDYKIEVESASDLGLLLLSNIGNKRSDFKYLADSLEEISLREDIKQGFEKKKHMPMLTPEIKMNMQDAFYAEKEIVSKNDVLGRISGEIIAECPPGISILVPGELITKEHLPYLIGYDNVEVLKEF